MIGISKNWNSIRKPDFEFNSVIGHPVTSSCTASLRSCEYSNFDELCMHKIHYKTMILYLNYKNNVYKLENLNEKSGR